LHFITLALTEAEQSIAADEQSRPNVGVVIAREHVNWRAHTDATTNRRDLCPPSALSYATRDEATTWVFHSYG
jgi:hypothetical protein